MIAILTVILAITIFIFLTLIIIGYTLSKQIEYQHDQLMQTINALATMIGEAIDQSEKK